MEYLFHKKKVMAKEHPLALRAVEKRNQSLTPYATQSQIVSPGNHRAAIIKLAEEALVNKPA